MSDALACPICTMTEILDSETEHECVTCGHEWPRISTPEEAESASSVTDVNGNVLRDGDSVTVIKDLKVKGSSVTLKAGTKIKGIRVPDDEQFGGHDIEGKFEGMAIVLKAKFLKKA